MEVTSVASIVVSIFAYKYANIIVIPVFIGVFGNKVPQSLRHLLEDIHRAYKRLVSNSSTPKRRKKRKRKDGGENS